MRCAACQGTGRKIKTVATPVAGARLAKVVARHPPLQFNIPCEACGGTGISHCCEGERSQPEEK